MAICTGARHVLYFIAFVTLITRIVCPTIDQLINDAFDQYEAENPTLPQNSSNKSAEVVVRIEYDMLFTKEQYDEMIQQEEAADTSSQKKRKKRKAVKDSRLVWPSKTVPYEIANDFSANDVIEVKAAIAEWHTYTCIRFRLAQSADREKIVYQNGQGCSSYVGRQRTGVQGVTLHPSCRRKSVIVHEMGHAIGFYHEQSRPDRDTYIKVLYNNIIPGRERNFRKWTNVINTLGVPYDYKSVMHYGQYAFSLNAGQRTLETIDDPGMQNVIGNAQGLSFRDIQLANVLYRCSESCQNPPVCPPDGFLGQDCRCWCPGNPVTFCEGTWLPWNPWSACSVTCDGGSHTRSRSCDHLNGNCRGNRQETTGCNKHTCGTCGKVQLTASSGSFASPGFPKEYGNNLWCTWTIQVATGPITLTFTKFNVESCGDCGCDYVSVRDGSTDSSQELIRECGSIVPQPVRSTGNALFITFRSDHTVKVTGFSVNYQSVAAIWGPFGTYSACSVTCGLGVRSRSRSCNPPNGGCIGLSQVTENCQEPACDPYNAWAPWSECDRTCGGGSRTRNRQCRAGSQCPQQDELASNDCNLNPCRYSPAGDGVTLMRCDFETPCPRLVASSDDGKYIWATAQCCTPSFQTGPFVDHTFSNISGHMIFTEASYSSTGVTARLKTEPPFRHNRDQLCVRFWYHMRGEGMGTLSVTYMEEGKNDRIVWTKQGNQGDDWKEAYLQVKTERNRNMRIVFEAVRGIDYTSDVCLDDVTISSCGSVDTGWGSWGAWRACSVTCDAGTRQRSRPCPSGQVCEGAATSSESCEKPKCRNELLKCDFETVCSSLVPFNNPENYEWLTIPCCTPSTGTGPSVDHTTGTIRGHFIYAEASYCYRKNITNLQTTILRHSNSQGCLRFWYHMSGGGIGSLQIFVAQTGFRDEQIWSRSGHQQDEWLEAVVSFSTRVNRPFRLRYRATCGLDYAGDISIDDVIVTSGGCPQSAFLEKTWSAWTSWSACSVTCSGGVRSRFRTCPAGALCAGSSTETEDCLQPSCPDECDVNSRGVHSFTCLYKWWLDAGCSSQGLQAPSSTGKPSDTQVWWSSQLGTNVQDDMMTFRRDATEDGVNFDEVATELCFGERLQSCGNGDTSGPHETTCLMKWWLEAGCTPTGTSSPNRRSTIVLDGMSTTLVKERFRQERQYAIDDDPAHNVNAVTCLGENKPGDCTVGGRSGPHPMTCLMRWWLQSGCSPKGTDSPNRYSPAEYGQATAQAVYTTMTSSRNSAFNGFSMRCYGENTPVNCSGRASDRPHSLTCLMLWWVYEGCSFKGMASPTMANLDKLKWYHEQPAASVKSDMRMNRESAIDGRTKSGLSYAQLCYGESVQGGCDNGNTAGPHKVTCLMKWWLAAGCSTRGLHSPAIYRSPQWNQMTPSEVQENMRKHFLSSLSGKSLAGTSYRRLCQGPAFDLRI